MVIAFDERHLLKSFFLAGRYMTENDVEKDFRPAPWLTERLDHYTWRDRTAYSERTATRSRTTRQSQKVNESLIRFQPRNLQQELFYIDNGYRMNNSCTFRTIYLPTGQNEFKRIK
jgi:hypothetical protein